MRRDACGGGSGPGWAAAGGEAPGGSEPPAQPTPPRRDPGSLKALQSLRAEGRAVGASLVDEMTLFFCCCWGFSTRNGLCQVS